MLFALNYVFNWRLGIEYTIIENVDRAYLADDLVINYSTTNLLNSIQIIPDIIIENYNNENILKYDLYCQKNIELKSNKFNFDFFASIFFHLSNYEEYHAKHNEIDKHGRFISQNSILFKKNILNFPIVDFWILELKKILKELNSTIQFKDEKFNILPTIDIDSVFSYKGKSFFRTLKGVFRDLIRLKFHLLKKRFNVLINNEIDPFDNFDYQIKISESFKLKIHYFILVAENGQNNKPITIENISFQDIILKLKANNNIIGLHPGYSSLIENIKNEKNSLERIIKINIETSRQHFLKMDIPKTYHDLIQLEIKKDYTNGYSDLISFKSGTSKSFFWYDLSKEMMTNFIVQPFSVMDVALKRQFGNNIILIIDEIKKLKNNLKSVNGDFCFIFHNESLSDFDHWKNWRKVFEECLKP